MSDTGWIVGGVMTSLAFAMEVRDPYSLAWVFFTARFVYGADRYYDGKTIDNDSIESILLDGSQIIGSKVRIRFQIIMCLTQETR